MVVRIAVDTGPNSLVVSRKAVNSKHLQISLG